MPQPRFVLPPWRKPATILTFGLLLLMAAGQERVLAQVEPCEREPEPKISLSAGAIVEILRREPGLLLEVKRLLVRKAYEQGRLLDPADLTDDALFQLLKEDDNVRVLATQEIENREYVRPKPTRREMESQRIGRLPSGESAKAAGSGPSPAVPSEEEKYWEQHERRSVRPRTMAPPGSGADSRADDGFADDGFAKDGFTKDGFEPEPATPPPSPWPAQPAIPVSPDAGRRQSLAGLQPQDRDSYTGAAEAGSLPRISPEGVPGLLSASLEESGATSQKLSSGDAPSLSYDSASSTSRQRANPPGQFFASASAATDAGFGTSTRQDTRMQRPASSPPEENRPAIRRRANPYAEVPSLYDLYTQISRRSPVLARFGEDIFRNGTGNFDELPMDLPVGPDYVLGPGDGLSIELWGGISERLQRVVDREGRVALPEAGAVEVTGRSLGDVQQLVQSALRREFHEVHADVSLARLRTVRVYVVGDVLRPGAYNVSSLSTPLNALYQAGGPTSRGSLRILRHYRGPRLIAQIDLYDLLLHGVRSTIERLQAGDTIMVPPLGAELTVEGMVRRPAIYELNHEANLAEALELAGGVLTTGTLRHIEVERVIAHERRSMLRLDLPELDLPELDLREKDLPENNSQEAVTRALEDFKIQDGDKIRISPILPYSEQTVYLDGHVVHPGKHAYREGMRITDLIASYTDLLPEPAERHAEIIRLTPPDYAPQVIAFNLADALAGRGQGRGGGKQASDPNPNDGQQNAQHGAQHNAQNVTLQPFDTVRIFGRYDFEDAPLITVSGEVRHPGEHVTNGETHLRDAVYLAGGVSRDARLTDAQVFRHTPDGKLKVLSVNLERALAGEAADNVALEPKDRVFIHRNLSKVDPATVKIEGEVARGENIRWARICPLRSWCGWRAG